MNHRQVHVILLVAVLLVACASSATPSPAGVMPTDTPAPMSTATATPKPTSQLDDLKTSTEIMEAIVKSAGILAAGIWSFYVFVLGRSFAPNVRMSFRLRHAVDTPDRRAAVVSITIKNIGKTKVRKESCWIFLIPIALDLNPDAISPIRLDSPLDLTVSGAKAYSVFTEHTWLEPGEKATEDVVIALGESPVFKIAAVFAGRRKKWTASAVLDAQVTEESKS